MTEHPTGRGEARRPWSHEIPEGRWDTIVIGSGIGGMTTAAMLAKVGQRVLVLEQHVIPGGFTQTFKRPGYHWDVGVHIVGEMTTRSFAGRLLADLTDGRLEWASVGPVYDEFNFPDGFTIQFPDSPEAFRETLIDYFPHERQGIDDYLALVRNASRASGRDLQMRATPWYLAPGGRKKAAEAASRHYEATTQAVLESLVDDPRLRSVLAAQWGYYGVPPSRSSFAMHALMVQHFLRGAFYPIGSAASIAPALLETVAGSGGWTAVRRSVDEIVVRRGRVVGVRLGNGVEIGAKRVVSAAGAIPTASMLGDSAPDDWSDSYREPGPAHLSLYLGFSGVDVATRGAEKYCQWYYDSWDTEAIGWDVHPERDPGAAPVVFCSFPSIKDPAHDPGSDLRHTGEAITFVPWEPFSRWQDAKWKRRGPDYEAFKSRLTEALLDQYRALYPALAPHIEHAELSTPVSTHHFTSAPAGSIYGLATEPDRFSDETLLPEAAISGLYLSGADVGTPGVAGALMGGVLAAVASAPVAGGRYVRSLMSR
ncbi:MAG: NAD(P)/FAD-dependent oxidoreductase [Acidimicrobiia bacterium]|nr:NAD(P)/FAD-dependent oxidoreductase [Acidimicrobiia bacterium]